MRTQDTQKLSKLSKVRQPLCFQTSGPQPLWYQKPTAWKTIFPQTWRVGERYGMGMIQMLYINWPLYFFYYYCINLTSD